MKVGQGLEKPGKPYIITVNIMGYTASQFLFLPLVKGIKMTLVWSFHPLTLNEWDLVLEVKRWVFSFINK